jgi:hypothetical protein
VFIENIFVNFESKPAKQESLVVNDKKTIKKTTAPVIKKKAAPKKKKEPTEKKPINWPLLKVLPPLSDLIHTDLVSKHAGTIQKSHSMIVFSSSNSQEAMGVYQRT